LPVFFTSPLQGEGWGEGLIELDLVNIKAKLRSFKSALGSLWVSFSRPKKILFTLSLATVITILLIRLFTLNYQNSEKSKEYQFGTTFVKSYAEHLGINPKEAYIKILEDLNIKNIRLVSYWSEGEKNKGEYNFTELDWQFQEAEKRGIEVSLSIGLRQPRWPECHMPEWSKNLTKEEWYPELKKYLTATVARYKDSPNLKSYQLENEYFLKDFGVCPDYSRERLVDEFNLVKSIDSKTPLVLSRSNNYGGFAINEPVPDIYGISVYRKVYNQSLGFVTYPFPAWYYAFLAAGQQAITGRPSIIHEFQLEPWLKDGEMKNASVEDQDKTMSPEDIKLNIDFARKTGIKEVYFWGSEWWYWRLQNGDPTIWNTVKENLEQ